MDLYIIRHGVAADIGSEVSDEGQRYLSIHGRNHCKIVAHRLKDMNVKFDAILTSPLVRAVQTAELFGSVLKFDDEIKTAVELIGGHSFSRFVQMINRNAHYKSIGIFGHAPDVNSYSLNLISGSNPGGVQMNFKNASVCKIEYDPSNETGKFVWFLNSENMKLIEPA